MTYRLYLFRTIGARLDAQNRTNLPPPPNAPPNLCFPPLLVHLQKQIVSCVRTPKTQSEQVEFSHACATTTVL